MIVNLLIALVFTLLIELIVALLFGFKKNELIVIILINVVTNLIMNYFFIVFKYLDIVKINSILVFVVEVVVILVEWYLLSKTIERKKISLFIFSIIANTSSYFLGPLLFGLFLFFK